MNRQFLYLAPLSALALGGCLARTAIDVVTLPVRVASAGVDAVTTSQSEADQKRGREIRQREERLGKLEREFYKLQGKCLDGDKRACERQVAVRAQMDTLAPTIPYEPR